MNDTNTNEPKPHQNEYMCKTNAELNLDKR